MADIQLPVVVEEDIITRNEDAQWQELMGTDLLLKVVMLYCIFDFVIVLCFSSQ